MVLGRQRCGGLLVRVPDSVETFGSLCYVLGRTLALHRREF